jgi:hypothetical protein
MRTNEGMALRRASAMIEPLEFEAGDDLGLDLGSFAAATAAYRAEVAATPPTSGVDRAPVIPPIETPSPISIASPDSPSPFADTKYIKRHSNDAHPGLEHAQHLPTEPVLLPPVGRSPFADPKYLQSRLKDPSPSRPLRRDENDQANYSHSETQPAHLDEPQSLGPRQPGAPPNPVASHDRSRSIRQQHADMTFVVPQGPRDPSPDKLQRPAQPQLRMPEQPSYTRAAPSTGYENMQPVFARPMPAPRMATEAQPRPNSRDRSPPRDRTFDSQQPSQNPATVYGRPNQSNTSINRFAPASGAHSRTNSQDQMSPQSIRSVSENMSPPPLRYVDNSRTSSPPSQPGFMPYTQTQTHPAARPNDLRSNEYSSVQLGPPKPSPYARGPSPNGYFDVERQHPMQPARSPMATLLASDASRPGSAHSTKSLQAPKPQDVWRT